MELLVVIVVAAVVYALWKATHGSDQQRGPSGLLYGRADNVADGVPVDSDGGRAAIVECAQRTNQVLIESLKLAHDSKNLETRTSRLALARRRLRELRDMAQEYPFLTMDGFDDVEATIERVELDIAEQEDRERAGGYLDGANRIDAGKKMQPARRLQNARELMPLPAAFREAAIALRAIVRAKRKAGQDYEYELRALYLTCAQESFLFCESECPEIAAPSFNIAESMERDAWESLPMPYEELGYEVIALLKKTDAKWLVEQWGEPQTHRLPRDYHLGVWQSAIARFKVKHPDWLGGFT